MSAEGNSKQKQWEELRAKVIEAISSTMDLYGAAPSVGTLYGTMFFEDRPMTLEEMKDMMGMSKSNMSYAARALLESKMITKLNTKHQRKDLYQAEGDFYRAFQNFFSSKLQREKNVMTEAIQQVLPELKELILHIDTPESIHHAALKDLHKLYHAIQYYDWLQVFIDDLREGLLFERSPNRDNFNPNE